MPGIPRAIQPLHLFHRLFRQLRGLAVNRRAATAAFPYGVKLAATERANVVNETGLIFLKKGTLRNRFLLLFQFILDDFLLHLTPERLRQTVDALPDDSALKGGDVDISHVCAAIGAPYFADGVFLELIGIPLKAFIYLLQSLLLFFQCHSDSRCFRKNFFLYKIDLLRGHQVTSQKVGVTFKWAQAARKYLFSGLVKTLPASQGQLVSGVSGQATRKRQIGATRLLVSGSGRHIEHSAVVLPVRPYQ